MNDEPKFPLHDYTRGSRSRRHSLIDDYQELVDGESWTRNEQGEYRGAYHFSLLVDDLGRPVAIDADFNTEETHRVFRLGTGALTPEARQLIAEAELMPLMPKELWPGRRFMTSDEADCYKLQVRLDAALDRLTDTLFPLLPSAGEDKKADSLRARLSVVGLSMMMLFRPIGRFALSRWKPYWLRADSPILDDEQVRFCRGVLPSQNHLLLEELLVLDERLRRSAELVN